VGVTATRQCCTGRARATPFVDDKVALAPNFNSIPLAQTTPRGQRPCQNMSSRPSRIGSNVQRYESGLKNPQPPGAITSPPRTSPRKARRMSVLSSEIMKFNPDGSDKVSQYPDIGAKKDSYGALPVDSDSDDEGGKSGRPRSSDVSPRSTREASRSPVRSATTGLKSLGGSSYDLGEFYASMTPSEETTKTKKSPRPRSALFSRSPRSPVLGSATQQAAAERSGRRRSPRAGRKKYNEEGKVTSADDANSMKSKSSKLQLLDDLLAQVKSTHDSFSVQLGDAKKEAKRIMKRTERDGRRLTYTKTRLDGALHGL